MTSPANGDGRAAAQVRQAVDRLPTSGREVILLHYFSGLSYEQISQTLGITPQSVHALGGFRVQGKDLEAARAIVDDAVALADAGCFAIVLECVPDAVARLVTDTVEIPTIGIGAGRHCDGQVLVFHDVLGIEDRIAPKFVRCMSTTVQLGVPSGNFRCYSSGVS